MSNKLKGSTEILLVREGERVRDDRDDMDQIVMMLQNLLRTINQNIKQMHANECGSKLTKLLRIFSKNEIDYAQSSHKSLLSSTKNRYNLRKAKGFLLADLIYI